jgi:hypothetical protein
MWPSSSLTYWFQFVEHIAASAFGAFRRFVEGPPLFYYYYYYYSLPLIYSSP